MPERRTAPRYPLILSAEVTDLASGVAAAVNGDVVPRGSWVVTSLRDGDQVEVVTAVQGG